MSTQDNPRQAAIDCARGFGVSPETAVAVVEAYERVGQRIGRSFNPASWTKTVWLAEADRFERSPDAEAHYHLIVHLNELREGFEGKVRRGARAWRPGVVGQRDLKR